MKSRASLVLMEQLLMVLVFALASAVCLQLFVKADSLAQETARRDEAVVIAQNAAELLKGGCDPEALDTGDYRVVIREEAPDIPGLATATVAVYYEEIPLYSLTTGWQEELP